MQVVSLLADSISMCLPVLVPALVSIIGQIATELTKPSNVDMILRSTLTIIGAVAVAIVKSIPTLLSSVGKVFSNILNRMISENNMILSKVTSFLASLITKVREKLNSLVTNAINIIKTLPTKVTTIGTQLVTGLWNGISSKVDWVVSKIRNMGSQITNAIKRVFGIASPSKVFAGIGGYLAEGLGVGFEDEIGDVKADMVGEMSGLTASMNANVTAYGTGSAATLGNSTTYNGGAITINVYGAEGQDVNSLADTIAQKLGDMTRRKELVYA
jgi:phage-related protein